MVEPRDILAMGDSTLRVLQWNVLADGLSGDGFLVQDVLESPGETDKLEAVLSAMDEVKRSGGDMFALKARLETPRASKNHAAIVDWTRRWRQSTGARRCTARRDHIPGDGPHGGRDARARRARISDPVSRMRSTCPPIPLESPRSVHAYVAHLGECGSHLRQICPRHPASLRCARTQMQMTTAVRSSGALQPSPLST